MWYYDYYMVTQQRRRNAYGEAQLQKHIKHTFPASLRGWLGKEHFWALGDMTEIRRATAGRLFMELCFPIKNKVQLGERAEIIDPTELGLKVSPRQVVGLSYPPVQVATMSTSSRAFAHFERRGPKSIWRDTQPLADNVIEIESVIAFATDSEAQEKAYFSKNALDALATFSAKLIEFPEA
jgi:hypothetical protein